MTRALIALLFVVTSSVAVAQIAQTRVAEGELRGKSENGVTAFLGVPFAAPPVGTDRWKAPRPAAKWQGARPADHFSASCQQQVTPTGFGPWTAEYVVQGDVSEDCLYLNVWTPARGAQDRLPVLFWIYGGAFTSGSGSVAIYDGKALAAQGIVVVSVNYRVGVYGFLAHPELTAESPEHASGNYALLDQIAGLRWVRDNIAAFGGDPSRVTIAGQSAGAASVHHLIATPLAKGLFAQAIAQSGSGMGVQVPDRATAEFVGAKLSTVGNSSLSISDLRKLTAADLDARVEKMMTMSAGIPERFRFAPIVDGAVLPDSSAVDRNTNDTPILTGLTANEMTGLNPGYGKTTVASFTEHVNSTYRKSAPQFLTLYPAKDDAQAWTQLDALARDRGLAALYFWAKARLQSSKQPIYAYLWTHTEPGPDAARYRAFHSSEIPYVFDSLDTAKRPFTAEDRALAKQVSAYWANFVKTGNPNGTGLPQWPSLTTAGKQILELGDRTHSRPILDPKALAIYERYQASGGRVSLF